MIAEAREEALAVALDEERIELLREAALVVREQRAFHPLHDIAPGDQGVTVDVETHLLAAIPERVEQGRVLLRLEDRLLVSHIAAQRLEEGRLRGDLRGHGVGGMIVVGRYLHGKLAARRERLG